MTAVSHLTLLLASTVKSKGSPAWLLLLGPAGGALLYAKFWYFYRNTHQVHSFERETRVSAQPATGQDTKTDELKDIKRSHVEGDNRANHRQRVARY